jgi:predicted amidohydrolase YtcJ
VYWVNTEALKRAGLFVQNPPQVPGGRIETDANGWPTGVLVDQAREAVEKMIPKAGAFEVRRDLLKGIYIFNMAGFTHIREMTCNELQWDQACKIDESGLLTLAVEEYFWLHDHKSLDSMLLLLEQARADQTPNLRVKGIKIFLDGALGSEGALLSGCYHGGSNRGLKLWETAALKEVFRKSWERGFEVAVHTIGDEAAEITAQAAVDLFAEGAVGTFHLEHAELLRPATVEKLKKVKAECHLQPAHWLSDRKWLKEKIGALMEHAFPWRRLQEAEIPFDFGSDAPIEPASIKRTIEALKVSAEAGIPRLLGLPTSYMGHRDLSWAPNSYTILENDVPKQVVFRGEHLN